MKELKEHDTVFLTEDFNELKQGTIGVIIYIYGGNYQGKRVAEVELQDNSTKTVPLDKLKYLL